MLDDDQGGVEPHLEVREQAPERLGLPLGDPRGRLVQQEHLRPERDHAGELGDAPRARRELLDLLVPVRPQAHGADEVAGCRLAARAPAPQAHGRAEEARGHHALEGELHHLEDGHRREEGGVLEGADETQPPPGLRSQPRGVAIAEVDASGVRTCEPPEHLEERRLAGPVRPDEPEDLAGPHLDRDPVEGRHAAEGLPDALGTEGGLPRRHLEAPRAVRRRGLGDHHGPELPDGVLVPFGLVGIEGQPSPTGEAGDDGPAERADHLRDAAGSVEDDEQEPEPRRRQTGGVERDEGRDAEHEQRAEQRTRQDRDPPDDRHDHDVDAVLGEEGRALDGREGVGVDRSAHPRDEPGEQEPLELDPAGGHGEGPRSVLVVADGHQQPPEPGPADVAGDEEQEHEGGEDEVVVAPPGAEEPSEHDGTSGVHPLAEGPRLLEDPGGHDDGEGQGRHREEEPLEPQRGEPDDDGRGCCCQSPVEDGQGDVPSRPGGDGDGDGRPDGPEGELSEAELAAEAGDDPHRQRHHGEPEDPGERERGRVVDPGRQDRDDGQDQEPEGRRQGPNLAELRDGLGQGPPGLDRGPRAALLVLPRPLTSLNEQPDEDDGEERELDEPALGVIPEEQPLDDPEGHAAEERPGDVRHARQDGPDEGPEQQPRPEGGARGEPAARDHEDGREGRQRTGDRPRQRRHAARRHPGHPGRLGVRGRAPQRKAEAAVPEEGRERDHDDRGEEEDADERGRHAQRADVEDGEPGRLGDEERRSALAVDGEGEDDEELRDAERGDDAHQPGGGPEAPDHGNLREGRGGASDDERQGQVDVVGDVQLVREEPEHGDAERADLPVGEVDDAVRPVDDHQPHAEQPIGEPGDHPEDDRSGRHLEPEEGHGRSLPRSSSVPPRNTARSRSSRCRSSALEPSKRISPFSMK